MVSLGSVGPIFLGSCGVAVGFWLGPWASESPVGRDVHDGSLCGLAGDAGCRLGLLHNFSKSLGFSHGDWVPAAML